MNMTETGKHLTHAPANLTEDATALAPKPGQPHHTPCGNQWCPDKPCEYAYHNHSLRRAHESVAYHTREGNTTPLRYAVMRVAMYQELVERHDHRCDANERYQREVTNRRNAKAKLGPWEFTLTYSPTKHGWSVDEAKDAMRTAMERLTRYYREELEELHATGEYTQAGHPHVHCWYRLTGGHKITTKSFKRAYPIWNPNHKTGPRGHEGGHHEPVKRTSDFAGYVEKDLHTSWLTYNITNEPDETQANVSEAEDDASQDLPSEGSDAA